MAKLPRLKSLVKEAWRNLARPCPIIRTKALHRRIILPPYRPTALPPYSLSLPPFDTASSGARRPPFRSPCGVRTERATSFQAWTSSLNASPPPSPTTTSSRKNLVRAGWERLCGPGRPDCCLTPNLLPQMALPLSSTSVACPFSRNSPGIVFHPATRKDTPPFSFLQSTTFDNNSGLGDAVVNPGTPLAKSKTVSSGGVSDNGGSNPLTGASTTAAGPRGPP